RGEAEPVAFISNKTPVSAIQFHGDSIYFLSKRGDDKFTSLYKISTSGGEAQRVFAHSNNIVSYALSNDGRYVAFRARNKADDNQAKLAKKGFKAEIYEEQFEFTHAWLVDLEQADRTA